MKIPVRHGMDFDRAAHVLMKMNPFGLAGSERIGRYTVTFHGERLYSLRRTDSSAVILIYADNPHAAVRKVRGSNDNND